MTEPDTKMLSAPIQASFSAIGAPAFWCRSGRTRTQTLPVVIRVRPLHPQGMSNQLKKKPAPKPRPLPPPKEHFARRAWRRFYALLTAAAVVVGLYEWLRPELLVDPYD